MTPLLLDPSESLIKGVDLQGFTAHKVSSTRLPVCDPSQPLFSVSSSGVLSGRWRHTSILLQPHPSVVFLCSLRRPFV